MAKSRRKRRHRRPGPGAPPGTLVIDPSGARPRITVIGYGPDDWDEQEVDGPDAIPPLLGKWPVVWVNVDGLGDEAVLRRIEEIFHLHGLVLEDITNVPQRAKVEQYGEALFIVTHMVSQEQGLQTEQLSLVLKPGVVLTVQEHPGDCLEPVRDRIRKGMGRIRDAHADYLTYAILDATIDHYFPVLEEHGERLEALEDAVLEHSNMDTISKIREAKRDLLTLRRTLWPQRDALNWIARDECALIAPETRPYLRDCYDHVTRILDTIETYRELASDLSATHLAAVSNQMNAVMKVLTMIATIFIPLTFVAGVYGMNFKHMPELGWPWGYAGALALMAAIAGAMVMYFRKKKWI